MPENQEKVRELATRVYNLAREVESKANALKGRLRRLDSLLKTLKEGVRDE